MRGTSTAGSDSPIKKPSEMKQKCQRKEKLTEIFTLPLHVVGTSTLVGTERYRCHAQKFVKLELYFKLFIYSFSLRPPASVSSYNSRTLKPNPTFFSPFYIPFVLSRETHEGHVPTVCPSEAYYPVSKYLYYWM
ncbi:hypothetical protein NDU88_005579 [Pleurodeles waltl]|uniref:Uncharacterized protein n=1 Tax=Pleurodeles waltl TaxID=8319 RepID=A0AAV7TD00_PLEWA|nr:hypothetical protein NDU88_005579 [Pleurodeles waltl]